MFFSTELLSLKKGRFGIVWLASTRGIKHTKKRDIMSVNIRCVCDELLQYFSGAKRGRFSLYLSAQLSFGLCVIYREKVSITLREAQDLYTRSLTFFRPQNVEINDVGSVAQNHEVDMDIDMPRYSIDGFGSLDLPVSLFNSQLDININDISFENSFSLQARFEDITLIEASTTPKHDEFTFGEDFRTEFSVDLFGDKENLPLSSTEISEKIFLNRDEAPSNVEEQISPKGKKNQNIRISFTSETERLQTANENDQQISSQLQQAEAASVAEQQNLSEGGKQAESAEVTALVELPGEVMLRDANALIEAPTIVEEKNDLIASQVAEKTTTEDKGEHASSPKRTRREEEESRMETEKQAEEVPPNVPSTESTEPQFPIPGVEILLPCAESSAQKSRNVTSVTFPTGSIFPVNLPELHESQLPPSKERGRRLKRRNIPFPIVDSPRKISRAELRANFESTGTIVNRVSDVRAPPASSTHPRRMLSLDVDRLLAVPARYEVAISMALSKLWKSKRQMCLSHNYMSFKVPASSSTSNSSSLLHSSTRDNRSTSLHALRESDLEASREEVRAGQDRSSSILFPRPSSSQLNVTIKDATNQGDASILNPPVSSSQLASSIPEDVIAVLTEMPQSIVLPLQEEEQMLQPPAPILEESLPTVKEPEINLASLVEVTQTVPEVAEVLLTDIRPLAFPTQESLGCFLDNTFKQGMNEVDFAETLVPRSTTSRKSAAKTFHHLLCLLKHGRVKVKQESPFQPIFICTC